MTNRSADVDLLRISTAGSVDDGKSTLVGRLLYETNSIFDDQLAAVERASRQLGENRTNLALLTDGLRAEREQKITIDVAYRYFSTRQRKFIIADTPGHIRHTRNMVTGASTADLAIVLVDATRGVHSQSRRHAFIASLLGIPHVIVVVNKMDLVDYAEEVYENIVSEFRAFAMKMTMNDLSYVPMSALKGDNVVTASPHMPWYRGGPLLTRLETVQLRPRNSVDFRFPVQCVVRPDQSFRGYAGTVMSGSIAAGAEVVVLPSRVRTRIASIETFDGVCPEATTGDAVVLTTTDAVDVSRGDMIVAADNIPTIAKELDTSLCWTDTAPLDLAQVYLLRQTTREVRVTVSAIVSRIDVDTLNCEKGTSTIAINDIGRVSITAADHVVFDAYRSNPSTGSFILIDPRTNLTVAAGMIRGTQSGDAVRAATIVSPNVVRQMPNISRSEREAEQGHLAGVVWLTGLPGAGKTTLARIVERRLFESGHRVALLDGDDLRHGLSGDLGFAVADRTENIRRAGEVARLFFENGSIVLCAFVSPYRDDRARARSLLPAERFIEVFVKADIATCRSRDPKGHYRRATAGDVPQFTGVTAPYEEPITPDLTIDTERASPETAAEEIFEWLRGRRWLRD